MYLLLAASDNPLLQPNPGLMIWTLVTFFLAMVIMYKFAFGPIQKAIDKRRQAITESVEAAERIKVEATELLDRYSKQLSDARRESESIVERARKAGEELAARVKAAAEAQRREAVAQTQQQVQLEVEKAIGELRSAIAEMTVVAAGKVLRGSIDTAQHQRLIEQSVDELDFARLQKVGAGS